jgi:hypothetical protein
LASPYQVQVRSRTYTVVDDLTIVYRVLITGVVNDEITDEPLQAPFIVRAGRRGLDPKLLAGGLWCFAGYPEQVFPDLSTTPDTVDVVITAPGYREVSFTVIIPQHASFPVSAPVVQLRRLPVRIQGRVVENTTGRTPIAAAKILIVDDPNPPQPLTEHLAALRTPLHFDHASGVTVHERLLSPTGSLKHLEANVFAGSRSFTLNNRVGLAANDIRRIGSAMQSEYGVIESLAPDPADPSQPGSVTLRSALIRSFRATTEVQRVTPGAAGTTRHLAREADAGDGVLILDGILDVDTIEIADPVPERVEYHALGALTDAEGFYRLDGISRVRTVYLDASAAGFTALPAPVPWTINYRQPLNIVNFRLSP